ncbi:hypothetical protein ACJRO7_004831 [Eucalyptus globulus]|uniref:Uncharacterized protein n=1 Tax=Eucalyptus globulus TaxID=34317 RepID=A0ABD3IZZ8_EUCGL
MTAPSVVPLVHIFSIEVLNLTQINEKATYKKGSYPLINVLTLLLISWIGTARLSPRQRRSYPAFVTNKARLGHKLAKEEEKFAAKRSRVNIKCVLELNERLFDLRLEILILGEFLAKVRVSLYVQEVKVDTLEKEQDHFFEKAYKLHPSIAQSEQANSHMEEHAKDFLMAIKRQLTSIPIANL